MTVWLEFLILITSIITIVCWVYAIFLFLKNDLAVSITSKDEAKIIIGFIFWPIPILGFILILLIGFVKIFLSLIPLFKKAFGK